MRFITFIEKRDQADVIEKILKHCDPWREPGRRATPGIVPDEDADLVSLQNLSALIGQV